MTSPGGRRSTWAAVAWAEGLILAGIALVGAAVATSARFCTFSLGCDGKSSVGGGSLVLLALGLVAIVGSPVAAARSSGRPAPGRAAALAALAFVLALVVLSGVLHSSDVTILLLALLTLPAIGLADTLSGRPT